MVVSSTGFKAIYTGDNSTTSFSFPNHILEANDLKVFLDGVQQGSGFSLDAGSFPATGTNVIFTSPPGTGVIVYLERQTDKDQIFNLTNVGKFDQESLEGMFDRITLIMQEASGRTQGAVIAPASLPDGFNLPEPVVGEFLVWNATSDGLENSGTTISNLLAAVQAAETNAQNSATASANSATASDVARAAAVVAQLLAEGYANDASASATAASASAVDAANQVILAAAQVALAQDEVENARAWAVTDEDVVVDAANYPGEFSARHWATKSGDAAGQASAIANGNDHTFTYQVGDFTAANGAAYYVEEGATITIPDLTPVTDNNFHFDFINAHGDSFEDTPVIISPAGNEEIAGVIDDVRISENGWFRVFSQNGSVIEVQKIGEVGLA